MVLPGCIGILLIITDFGEGGLLSLSEAENVGWVEQTDCWVTLYMLLCIDHMVLPT